MRGDAEAFGRLYEEHVWNVYGFFGYRVTSRQEAEDLTQATFENALKAFHRFDERRASFSTWVMTIARNLLIDHYRSDRSSRHEPVGTPDEAETALGDRAAEEHDLGLAPDLETALDGLGPREREMIALRFGGDMTTQQIAELTDLTVANVQQILSRSLRRLRAELEESGEAEPSRPSAASRRGGSGPG
jgi:RNA polymerase sigma-70 factor (ECF subfamily)